MRLWIYHKKEEPKIININELDEFEKDGWKDSPLYFIKLPDVNIDPEDNIAIQEFGNAVDGVRDSLNGALNLDLMSKSELIEYGKKHYGLEFNNRHRINTIKTSIKQSIDGPTIQ
jgi:hypothetical protein